MKYLGSYDTNAAYQEAVDSGNIIGPNVSFVESTNTCYYTPVLKNDFGDIAYYNTKTHKVEYYSAGSYSSMHHLAHMKAFGVVAVPAKYTPDGKTRIMSLKNMSTQNPMAGSTTIFASNASSADGDVNMCWGTAGKDISTLKNWGSVNSVNPTTGALNTSTDWVRIPSDTKFRNAGAIDPISGCYYYYGATEESGGENRFGPYPILKNGDKNSLYFAENKATNDFDGKGNTDLIISYAEDNGFSGWASLSTYEPGKADNGYFPAAFCCRRYSSDAEIAGSGDWYLPAEGELAFCVAKYGAINAGLKDVYNVDPNAGVAMGRDVTLGNWLWSSSETSSATARYVNLYSGSVNYGAKSYLNVNYRVRAFIAL